MEMNWKKESEGNEFTLYPDGCYVVKVESWKREDSKKKGTPQICWLTRITEGEFEGQTIIDYHALTEKALWRLGTYVKNCGVDVSDTETHEIGSTAFNQVLNACVGRKVGFRLYTEAWDGKERNKIVCKVF